MRKVLESDARTEEVGEMKQAFDNDDSKRASRRVSFLAYDP